MSAGHCACVAWQAPPPHSTVSRSVTFQCIDMIWQYAGRPSRVNSAPFWWSMLGEPHVPMSPATLGTVSMSGFGVPGPHVPAPPHRLAGNSAPLDCLMPANRR